MSKVAIILVAPQLAENIGAVARVMKNFALTDLRLVKPRCSWPNNTALSMATNAAELITQARIHDDLANALLDIDYLYAATARTRDLNKKYTTPDQIGGQIPTYNKVGIMFGRESSGLTNQELSLANQIVTIDTNVEFSSLNLAQAVAIIGYELFREQHYSNSPLKSPQTCSRLELQYFLDHLFTVLSNKNFFKVSEKESHMKMNIANLFSRIEQLSKNELQILWGIINILNTEK